VRHVNWLMLLVGLGLGGASAVILDGCAPSCGGLLEEQEYTECTSRPGLRYTLCAGSYEFNDGSHYGSEGLALDYCYCGDARVTCDDGRTASLCNTRPLDGLSTLYYDDDGTAKAIGSGIKQCLGLDGCAVTETGCNYQGWYLQCGDDYVSSKGEVLDDLAAAILSCNPDGDAGALSGSCKAAVDECYELADCSVSAACAGTFGECDSYVDCYVNKDLDSCNKDPACEWEFI
jgi:hypothetical protein